MTQQQALYKYCLRLGDNALVQSYRLSEWCSNGPILEEDLALTNFALDMTGRAQALLTYAGKIDGNNKTDDDLAYRRGEREFYNILMHELPYGDFANTIARLFYSATFEYLFFSGLMNSTDETLAAIAAKSIKEVKYHMAHATDWVLRLGDGTEESHRRMQNGISENWMFTGEMFEMDEVETLLAGVSVVVSEIKAKWLSQVSKVMAEATLTLPTDTYMQTGGRNGIHTEYLGHILSEMQYLQRAYPTATW